MFCTICTLLLSNFFSVCFLHQTVLVDSATYWWTSLPSLSSLLHQVLGNGFGMFMRCQYFASYWGYKGEWNMILALKLCLRMLFFFRSPQHTMCTLLFQFHWWYSGSIFFLVFIAFNNFLCGKTCFEFQTTNIQMNFRNIIWL